MQVGIDFGGSLCGLKILVSAVDAPSAWEISSDFTVGLNITEHLDSRPPSAAATKRDYQYSFSIGWS